MRKGKTKETLKIRNRKKTERERSKKLVVKEGEAGKREEKARRKRRKIYEGDGENEGNKKKRKEIKER